MSHFVRRVPSPPVTSNYRKYLPFVREDFVRQCAYCLLSEVLASGEENFELDHFKPRNQFPELLNDYYNLYYACHPCNHGKRDLWPPADLQSQGVFIVDLCKDKFASHFFQEDNGFLMGVTHSGSYTIDILRLNRKHLITIRKLLLEFGLRIDDRELTNTLTHLKL